ncbi:4-hydroxybutyrate dehydrogenase [Clostridium cavendishii DSM 21758]|uniref:4-hydroxybutyrate dehydrogenase n=1 Tax=Clostridium cavendishii DSM 21758 TaxID=1121302 RepID=A0A1M6IPM7_9CLOT|nr:4-hydroxybutyrate dehydrogenase [Clostridium cavendishii]SHJ36392.1 4-hydroxybutyrate dehydrogenase [Clostridium cavendishii DSM 21758]
MKLLELRPQIFKFNDCLEFKNEFKLNNKDLIFTNKFLYERFLKSLDINCNYIFQEDYNLKEPSDDIIDKILSEIKYKDIDRVIAIGGGSIIDIAKILVLKNVISTKELFERKIPVIKEKTLIIIPTTCGTGSEVTNISITEIKAKRTKMGLATEELFADYAVLIPELVRELPYEFFVYSSIDAFIHAIESLVSPKANAYTEMFSFEAIKTIINGYKAIIEKGTNYRKKIIEDFLIASNYAGIAFQNTGVGAVHALSYPLGGKYHVPHGEANYAFFIEVFKFYKKMNPDGKIKKVNTFMANILNVSEDKVYESLEELLNNLIVRKNLNTYGMKKEEIELFTDSVIETQQRLLQNNYVDMTREDIKNIYTSLF